MAPARGRQGPCVIEGMSAAEVRAVGRQVIPLLAGHLARLAADAHRGVREKAQALAFTLHGDLGHGCWSPLCGVWKSLVGTSAGWSADVGISPPPAPASRCVVWRSRRPART